MTRTLKIPVLDFRAALLDGLRKEYNKPREGIHASDLVNCRRQVAFERINGHREFTENTLMYFASGEFQHQKLQEILGDEFDCEREIIWNDIVFHPDVVWKGQNVAIEIKTARTDSVIDTPKPTHVKQLKFYMAVLNSPYGILQYIILNKYENMFPCHYVTIEADERKQILNDLVVDGEELRAGIDLRRPDLVGHVARNPAYMTEWGGNWLCRGCQFKQECDRMRENAGEFRQNMDKAIANRETFTETSKRLFTDAQNDVNKIISKELEKIPESWRAKK